MEIISFAKKYIGVGKQVFFHPLLFYIYRKSINNANKMGRKPIWVTEKTAMGEIWRKTGERGILITSYKRLKKRL